MYIDDEELRSLYKTSSSEHVQAIESALMQLEKQPQNTEVLKDLLRSAHTLKGDSRMLGVEDVETLVHQIEECLMPIEKGQTTMTSELCDRLYVGLDTVKQLAHTAVTGEPNDVNMFYVLATLMGDAQAVRAPRIAPIASLATHEQADLDLDGMASEGWFNTDEESVFDTPVDTWVHEGTELAAVAIDRDSSLPIVTTALQSSFLELAAELFPDDSTLPPLPKETVFSDFTLIPTDTKPELESGVFLADDDFTLIPNAAIDEFAAANVDAIWEHDALTDGDLFASDDSSLLKSDLADFGEPLPDLLLPAPAEIEPPAPSATVDLEPLPLANRSIVNSQPPAPPPASPAPPTPTVGDYQIDTIRVEAKQLDNLMGLAGEINVIDQQITSRLGDLEALTEIWDRGNRDYQHLQTLLAQIPSQSPLHHQLSRNHLQWEQMGELINKFKKAIGSDSSRLELVTSALESGVKKLRLLPLSTIFNLFPRMVRDLAKTQSKEINFAIEGGDLLLDKRLLEEIKDPLMHLLRNAIDHGIETPAERQQNGKLAAATLMIQVRQTGSQTTIEIADDGRGLDVQKIKATAIKRGLHTQNELDAMSVDRIQSLIFAPGFSTRARVTELSGRGVGLDIVRTNVERIKGSVDVESLPDRGCTFRIVLNHAIGSSQVMMVTVRDRAYAIPVEFVDRMLLLKKTEIFALGGTQTTEISGQTITVSWLADLLDLPAIAPDSPSEIGRTSNSISCLLLRSGRQQLALLVDRIDNRQLISIESPHPLLKNVPHLSGSTILGTGEVCLVLNPLDLLVTAAGGNLLLTAVGKSANQSEIAGAASLLADRPPTVLLVEDSLVIRTQMTRILKGGGYEVTVANDGMEGWEKLQAGAFDLVVSDVEMPRWGGLQLTSEIRKHSEYQHLPVVLVTTLSQASDRDRGFEAGANAYLTKGDFDQQLLLDTLSRLI